MVLIAPALATARHKVPPQMLYLVLLVLLALAIPIKCQNLPQQKLNIIILAGQSNMAGRGGVINDTSTGITTWDGVVPPQCQPNPSIFRLSADLAWVQSHEPIHGDIDTKKTNGIGPGMPFANAVLAKDPNFGLVGLVPCAIGGTNISEWQKGEFLYEQLVKRAQTALHNGVYRAMLWYEGESDTANQQDAEFYKGRLERFFNDLRSDLQAPMLPIFQVALASGTGAYTEEVREAQLNLVLSNVKCVDAKGLLLEPDGLHLTTTAQVKLGEMLADAFLKFKPSPLSSNDAPIKFSGDSPGPGPDPAQDIFILAGQSNMAGRGGFVDGKWDENVPPECQPNLSILRFTANLTWEEARDPLHADIDVGRACGVGPGMAFANGILTHGSGIGVVGLVPCAVGGTAISKWAKGSRLYGQLVTRAKESVKDGGAIRAILWYQGESDTGTKTDAEAYKAKLEKLIQNLRSDLNLPTLPFLQVALASGEGEFVETVRKAQVETKVPYVKCVDAKVLPLKADNIHLTTTSEVKVGLMLAHAFLHSFVRLR
ncbi:hypothetical protein PTKIN_Ptkin09bG0142200 [Pterospermum kingtungense]